MTRAILAGALLALLLLAYLTGIRAAYVLGYALSLLFLVAWIWTWLAARAVRVERDVRQGTPTVGEPFDEAFTVRRGGVLPAPWVEVTDRSGIPGYQPGRIVSVGRQVVTWSARGTYRRRGWMTFGRTTVRVREPFGLFSAEARLPERHRVLVRPRVEPIPELLLPAAHHTGLAERMGSWADYPPETGGVREYQPGDAYGRIHWPLSHKHGRLMSKTFEQPLTADLWLVLDLDRRAHWGEGDQSTVDCAVGLAASVADQVLSRGRKVGLVANDSRGTVLDLATDRRGEAAILDYLAVAEATGVRALGEARIWDRIRRLDRRAVVVITPSPDPGWVLNARALRGRGGALIVFYIDAASFGAPETELGFDLGADVELYVVRRGDVFGRLVRTRDAIRLD
ncbi:MAG: DUF58 domain-containing protein [Candidatus Dormiibacterota bacterium]